MANFSGTERSNYVLFRPDSLAQVKAYCDLFDITLAEQGDRHALLASAMSEDGCFGTYAYVTRDSPLNGVIEGLTFGPEDDGEEECEVDLDLSVIAKCMMPGEVLVVEKVGSEKQRYVFGCASAYNHLGEYIDLTLSDIYAKAGEAFGVDHTRITRAQY